MSLGFCVLRATDMAAKDAGKEIMFTITAAIHQPMAFALFLLSTRLAAQSGRQSHGEAGLASSISDCLFRRE